MDYYSKNAGVNMGYHYGTGIIREVAVRNGVTYDVAVKIQEEVSDKLDRIGCDAIVTDTGKTFDARNTLTKPESNPSDGEIGDARVTVDVDIHDPNVQYVLIEYK